MRKKIEFQAEIIYCNEEMLIERFKAIGGWFLVVYNKNSKKIAVHSTTFISDPHHDWHIVKPISDEKPKENKLEPSEFEAK